MFTQHIYHLRWVDDFIIWDVVQDTNYFGDTISPTSNLVSVTLNWKNQWQIVSQLSLRIELC